MVRKVDKVLQIVKYFQVEILCIFLSFGDSMNGLLSTQLVEDKICINRLNVSLEGCLNLDSTGSGIRNDVLKDTAWLQNTETLLTLLPTIFFNIFLGYWLTKHPVLIKATMMVTFVSIFSSRIIYIINCVFFNLDANFILARGLLRWVLFGLNDPGQIIYGYIAFTASPKDMLMRYANYKITSQIGMIIGQYVVGYIMMLEPWFPNQPRNYLGACSIEVMSKICALMWIIFILDPVNPENLRAGNPVEERNPSPSEPAKFTGLKGLIVDAFSISSIIKLYKEAFRPRQSYRRLALVLLILSNIIYSWDLHEETHVDFLFTQRAYSWNARVFTQYNSTLRSLKFAVSMILPFFITKYAISCGLVGLLTSSCFIAMLLVKGSVLSPIGYIISECLGSTSDLVQPAIKACFCIIVHPREFPIISGICLVITGIAFPVVSTSFTKIFVTSLDFYPGLFFHVLAFSMVIPMMVFAWVDLYRKNWKSDQEEMEMKQGSDKNLEQDQHKP